MNRIYCVFVFSTAFLVTIPALARSPRVSQIPNGRHYTCDSCHGKSSLLEEDLTPFGVDVNNNLSSGNVVWGAIYNLDSDGDGFSNGLELGDPNGTWRSADGDPDSPTANPGVANGGICGNELAEAGEDCESSDFRGATCASLAFGEGTLRCHPALCQWDTLECGRCGDGYLNPNYEDCDQDALPDDLGCSDYGFLRGELSCDAECDIDTSTCTDEAPAVCGDGLISSGELCDGDNFGTVDCVRIAYAGGTLECTTSCKWEASNCLHEDGTRVGDEERAAADPGAPYLGQEPAPDNPASTSNGGTAAPGRSCSTADGSGTTPLVWLILIGAVSRKR